MFEFGFDDLSVGETYESYRAKWIAEGMPWRYGDGKPPRWEPKLQLRNLELLEGGQERIDL